jgi:hypothetical protein
MSYKNLGVNRAAEESIQGAGCRAGSEGRLRGKILTSKNN